MRVVGVALERRLAEELPDPREAKECLDDFAAEQDGSRAAFDDGAPVGFQPVPGTPGFLRYCELNLSVRSCSC